MINLKMFIMILIILLVIYLCKDYIIIENFTNYESDITTLTDNWLDDIIVNKDLDKVYKQFCSDSTFIGNVTSIKKSGEDIKNYFDYFIKLPGLNIVKKKYNIMKISDNIYTNTAYITWTWDDINEPLNTKIILTFKNKCIYQIHSDALPNN